MARMYLELPESGFRDFRLICCGCAQCEAGHSYGPASRSNYSIHYILGGKGDFRAKEQPTVTEPSIEEAADACGYNSCPETKEKNKDKR